MVSLTWVARLAQPPVPRYDTPIMPGKKILLVDDEASVIKVVRRRLETQGYAVVTAADGIEGLEKAMEERPDLIISDVMMPDLDGYSMIRALRGKPEFAKTPIIVLTAKDRMQELLHFEGIKDCDYIIKPFETEVLLEKIAQLMKRVQSHLGDAPSQAA